MDEVIQDKDAYFKERNKVRVAEPMAEKYLKDNKIRYTRFGLDHLDSTLPIKKIPKSIRSIPDFIVWTDTDSTWFFEAKGFKRVAKFKKEDMKHYETWNDKMKIIFFIYDCEKKKYCKASFEFIKRLIEVKNPPLKHYPESKKNTYYEINVEWLPKFLDI